jgi:RsiW-degrading membrane proteinase PrsW (M82 family)
VFPGKFLVLARSGVAKFYFLNRQTWKHPAFDYQFDGIVYAVCVGLGFAAIENVFYVLGSEDWLSVAVMRASLSVPGHYAFAVIMGYCYAVYRFVKPSVWNALMIFVMPMMAHGIYDALAMSGTVDPTIGGSAFAVLIYFCVKMQKIARNRINRMIARDRQRQASQTLVQE